VNPAGGTPSEDTVPELESLQEYFAARLPDRLRELEEAWDRVREAAWSEPALKDFHRLVHSLVGAGATFGFPALTVASRALERRLLSVLRGGEPPPAASTVDDLIGWLREASGKPAEAEEPVL
jgi:chemotaxis protein histidine kinase CheA